MADRLRFWPRPLRAGKSHQDEITYDGLDRRDAVKNRMRG
jgi:hypothetical protein